MWLQERPWSVCRARCRRAAHVGGDEQLEQALHGCVARAVLAGRMLLHSAHSGAKKAHDWMVDQVADFFRTTHKVKTQQVVKNRGQYCGDIDLAG